MIMIAFDMAHRLSFLSIVLSICISISSVMCALHIDKPYSLRNNSGESNVFNIEKPGLAIVGFSGQAMSPFIPFPDSNTANKLSFKFWLFKKYKTEKNTQYFELLVLNIIYVFVSINAP